MPSSVAPEIRGAHFRRAAFEEDWVASRFLGRHLMVVSRPAAVHRVLVENADNYLRPHAAIRVLGPPIGGGLFLAEGAEWRRQRKLLSGEFSPRAVPRFAATVLRHAAGFVDRLTRSLGTPIELHAPLQALTLSITADALFGIELGPDGEAMRHLARCYTDRLAQPTLLDFLLPENWISPKDFQRRRFRRRWMALIERIVAERRRIRLETPDMFELLARSETEPGRFEQQVATMLITGSETSGAALFWAIYLVAAAPEIQALIAAEAAAASLDTADAAAVLPSLVHTQAVVQEAMRLYPPALSIVRQAREADMADGIPIPAGAIVEVAPYVLHRHRKYWAEPDRFDPSRFLPGAPPPERHTYLPFGVGPRICIGAQFALAETVLILATLIRRFRIEPTSDRPVGLVTRITLQPENPLPFRLSLRPEEAPAAPQMLDRPDQRPARCPVAGAL